MATTNKAQEEKLADIAYDPSRSIWPRFWLCFIIACFSAVFGEGVAKVVYGATEFDYYRGGRTGFTIGILSSLIEVFYIRSVRRSWIRRVAFVPGLIVRIIVLTVIVRVSLLFNELLTKYLLGEPLTVDATLNEQAFDTLFSMSIVLLFVVLANIASIVGSRRLFNLVVGRYFRPVNEQRIFMFVDLIGSSRLARELGDVRFHEYLSEFFYILDRAIVRTGGEVVSYVGDAVIVSWPLSDDASKNARCLVALRQMIHGMKREHKFFENNFGKLPKFRVALHCGEVVVGECGDSRRQVTFLGDVVNTTARIEEVTKELGQDFIASDDLVQAVNEPIGIGFDRVGQKMLKDAAEPIVLHRVVLQ